MRLPLHLHPNRESGTAPDSTCSWRTSNMNQTDSRGTRKTFHFGCSKLNTLKSGTVGRFGNYESCLSAQRHTLPTTAPAYTQPLAGAVLTRIFKPKLWDDLLARSLPQFNGGCPGRSRTLYFTTSPCGWPTCEVSVGTMCSSI